MNKQETAKSLWNKVICYRHIKMIAVAEKLRELGHYKAVFHPQNQLQLKAKPRCVINCAFYPLIKKYEAFPPN